ncbi:MAG: flagellar basal body rod protein FlgB [Phycisphaerales bacterium]
MFIDEVTSSGAMPTLEMMMRFAGARQRVLSHNIANIDTPNFRPADVSPSGFQRALAEAVQRRRAATGGETGELAWKDTREVRAVPGGAGGLELSPRTHSGNILFHDRNNRDLERTMQDVVENVTVFRTAVDFMRGRAEILKLAMTER